MRRKGCGGKDGDEVEGVGDANEEGWADKSAAYPYSPVVHLFNRKLEYEHRDWLINKINLALGFVQI